MNTIEEIRIRVEQEAGKNGSAAAFNNALYNYGWVVASACSILAGFLGETDALSLPDWVGPIMGMVAAIWIAIDKRLSFGDRWKFHRGLAQSYAGLTDRLILLVDESDPGKQREGLEQVVADLKTVRTESRNIPGAGSPG